MGRIRGRAFTPARDFVKQEFGEEGWQRVLARLAPPERVVADGLIVSESWYENSLFDRLIEAIRAEFGGVMPDLCWRIGQHSAVMNVPLFHRVFMKFSSPAGVFARAAALWKEYYDEGRMEVLERGENHYRVLLVHEGAHPWLAEQLLTGWAARVVEMTGHELVSSRLLATHEGRPPAYELYIEWR